MRATTQGAEAPRDHPPSGRPALLTAAQLTKLAVLLAQRAEAFGFRGAVWTRRRVAHLIKAHFGVTYHSMLPGPGTRVGAGWAGASERSARAEGGPTAGNP